MSQEITVVTESLIPSEKMLEAIIRHFGFRATAVEMAVYAYMRHLCPEYDGGMWSYYELSNGGFYMAPEGEVSAKYQSERLCDHYEWLWEYTTHCDSKSAQKIFAAID